MNQSWKIYLKRGKTFLSRHDPQSAVGCFEKALQQCPVDENEDLSAILYLCGIALMRLGQIEGAVDCWHSAVSVRPDSPASFMLQPVTSPAEQEWRLFRGIQLSGYFTYKKNTGFYSEQERSNIERIIRTYWEELRSSGLTDEMDTTERIQLYREIHIDFQTVLCTSSFPQQVGILPLRVSHRNTDTQE